MVRTRKFFAVVWFGGVAQELLAPLYVMLLLCASGLGQDQIQTVVDSRPGKSVRLTQTDGVAAGSATLSLGGSLGTYRVGRWLGYIAHAGQSRHGGFGIFTYTPSGQAAVVPLEARNASSYVLAFDNTADLATGLAIANLASSQASVGVVIRDDTGQNIGTGATLATGALDQSGTGTLTYSDGSVAVITNWTLAD